MLPPITLPITLQVDANMLAEEVISRIREALYAGLAPKAAVPAVTEPAVAQVPSLQVARPAFAVPAPPPPPPGPLPAVNAAEGPETESLPPGAEPSAPPAEPPVRTVRQWLAIYREVVARKNIKANTRTNTESNLRHIERLWGDMPIRGLRPRIIKAALQDGLHSDSLRSRVLSLMKDVLKEAVMDEWVETNAALPVDPIPVAVQRKRMSMETLAGAWEAATMHSQEWVAPMVLLGVVTGQRRADLAKMRFSDVVDGCLQVVQQKEAGKGYGSRLAIPLDLRLDAIGMSVGEVIERCREYAPPGDYLVRQRNGKPLEKSNLSARFTEIMRKAFPGVYREGEWPSLHELRSLSERLYRKQGIDTQTLLGHTDIAMTNRYNDDRGLTAKEFKRVGLAQPKSLPV
ncbi:MAG: hypothetical protein DI587_17075 [Variovorax paradoxus]|nr:MAG: hypothetical protein DI583_17075 [Variovorax paradoxus]PZQ08947.1 MAG: hypothetical protein DI587_17075 [Variovorax paradoxus]